MKRLQRVFDRWLFDEYHYDFRSLALFRIVFASYLLLTAFPDGLWLRDYPAVAFSPPLSLAAFFQGFPPNWVVVAANAGALLGTALLLIGFQTPITSFVTVCLFVLIRTFCYADGKIDHDILIAVVPLVLAGSGWGNELSADALRGRPVPGAPTAPRPWLLAILALLIGLALFTAGIAKVWGGWLRLESQATVFYLLPNYYMVGREQPLASWALTHLSRPLWEVMDWVPTLWECSVVLLVLRRRWFLAAIAAGCAFHLGVFLLFGITFAANVVAYSAFLPWSALLARWTGRWKVGRLPLAAAFLVALAAGAYALFGARESLHDALSIPLSEVIVVLGMVGALVYAAVAVRARLSTGPDRP
jgi:uncharacterized membrane protein YphA (DoxX/SURF4 family)